MTSEVSFAKVKEDEKASSRSEAGCGLEGGDNVSQDTNSMQEVMSKNMSGALESPDRALLVLSRLPPFRRPSYLTS